MTEHPGGPGRGPKTGSKQQRETGCLKPALGSVNPSQHGFLSTQEPVQTNTNAPEKEGRHEYVCVHMCESMRICTPLKQACSFSML